MANETSSNRVLIVGAGPVGCTAALALAQAGIPVVMVEQEATLARDMRASTFHPPSLDMLARYGLTQRLLPQGLVADRYQYRDRISGAYAEFDMDLLKDVVAHPFRLQCEQYKLTQTAVEMLKDHPHAEVRMATRAVSVAQSADGVSLGIEGPNGAETLHGRYLIAADSTRSVIRKAAGIEFEGFTYPELFLVISTAYPLEKHFENLSFVNYMSGGKDWCTILRVPTHWRVLFPTPQDASAEDLGQPEAIEARMQGLASKPGAYDIDHISFYRIHQRVAKQYRAGNVLLAGDSAHANNPLGGMGMNGGLHDAVNLCDKLIAIMQQGASEDLLDLYERQRRTVTVDFIQTQTIQNKKNVEESDAAARAKRIDDLRRMIDDKVQAKAFLRRNNMIDAVEASYAIT